MQVWDTPLPTAREGFGITEQPVPGSDRAVSPIGKTEAGLTNSHSSTIAVQLKQIPLSSLSAEDSGILAKYRATAAHTQALEAGRKRRAADLRELEQRCLQEDRAAREWKLGNA